MTGISNIEMAHAETRALLVASWKFDSPVLVNLEGAKNDLAAMNALMRKQGATDVTVLGTQDVSRTAVETALHALGLRSKPGDWIVFYYAGHGAEAEAAVKGTPDGDRDQFVPLPGFDLDHEDVERFIVDKDFYAWLDRYIPRNVQVLMIADTCHSGTMNRSIDLKRSAFVPRLGFRGSSETFTLIPRKAPQFPGVLDRGGAGQVAGAAAGAAPDRADLPNVIYISASKDSEYAGEMPLPHGGDPARGLMTYAFEQGLTQPSVDGKTVMADKDGDGFVSVGEIAVYVSTQVREQSGEAQQPQTSYSADKADLHLFAAVPPATKVAAKPALSVYAAQKTGAAMLTGADVPWRIATDAKQADFVWDNATGNLQDRVGDRVAQGVNTLAALRGVIEKWNAVAALNPMMDETLATLRVGPDHLGARYRPGSTVSVALDHASKGSAGPRYATIFNIASDGTIQLLYPYTHDDGDGRMDAAGTLSVIQNRVIPPFGVDHVVAVVTEQKPDAFRALITSIEDQRAAGTVVEPIRRLLADAHNHAGLSIVQIHTGD